MPETFMTSRVVRKNESLNSRPAYLGIVLAILSSFFFSLCSVIVKGMKEVSPLELALFRFIGLLPAIPIVIYKEEPVFPKSKRLLLVLRCLVGSSGLVLSFFAFRHMGSLADASVIIFSTPVFVAIFAKCFLNEPCGLFNIITITLTICGIVLITQPTVIFGSNTLENDNKNFTTLGPVAAFSSTLFGALAYVLLRSLKTLHFSVIMSNFGIIALLYTFILSVIFGTLCLPQCGLDRILIVALAVFSFGGQILLTLALQIEQAGPVSIARSSDILFAFIWQMIFYKEVPGPYTIAGAVLVVTAVIISGMRKYVMSLPLESNLRQKYKFLTIE